MTTGFRPTTGILTWRKTHLGGDAQRPRAALASDHARGNSSQKVEPSPGVLSTPIVPFIAPVIIREM